MKVLFLSHCPHEVHLEFAKSIKARIKITGLNHFVLLSKNIFLIGYLYPIISFIYSFFIKVKEDILLVDGASSLYLATFIKLKNPEIKIIYLDGDIAFYKYNKSKRLFKKIQKFFFKKIDAVISVSKSNKEHISKNINVPIKIVSPYPKQIKKLNINKENYGLYIGRLDADKNIKRIVQFGLQCPYFDKFFVIGEGTCRKYIERYVKKNRKIEYLGFTKNIDKFYNKCKFLIHIPDYDPHPCTTMESALCGCFPIISANTGTNYLFDKSFIINNPDNFEEINKRVKFIIDNENEAKKLLNKSIKKFPTKKYSIQSFKKTFNEIIKNLQ